MRSIEQIIDFVKQVEFYLESEYDQKWLERFKDYKNSVHIDYALTDCFVSDKTVQYTVGIVVDILRLQCL